jgi:post-segregation antitoxin (ccd killing protein)
VRPGKNRKKAPPLELAMRIEEALFITDGRLVEAARRERIDYSALVNDAIARRPEVARLLQNLDQISDEDISTFTQNVLKEK